MCHAHCQKSALSHDERLQWAQEEAEKFRTYLREKHNDWTLPSDVSALEWEYRVLRGILLIDPQAVVLKERFDQIDPVTEAVRDYGVDYGKHLAGKRIIAHDLETLLKYLRRTNHTLGMFVRTQREECIDETDSIVADTFRSQFEKLFEKTNE